MNNEHCNSIRHFIDSVKDNVSVRLPPEENLHCQRNGHCHLYGCLIDVFLEDGRKNKQSYRDIPDKYFEMCMEVLEIATKYAEDPNVYTKTSKKTTDALASWMNCLWFSTLGFNVSLNDFSASITD